MVGCVAPRSKPKPRPASKRPDGTTQLNLNVPTETMERLDAAVERLNERADGPRWTRTDLVKRALGRTLDQIDKGETQ